MPKVKEKKKRTDDEQDETVKPKEYRASLHFQYSDSSEYDDSHPQSQHQQKRYHENESYRKRKIALVKNRYHTDPERKKAILAKARERYHCDKDMRQKCIARAKQRYHSSENIRQESIKSVKEKYHSDEHIRQKTITRAKKRYHSSEHVRQESITRVKKKYHSDEDMRQKIITRAKKRYHSSEHVQQESINRDKKKYHSNEKVRQERIKRDNKKYHSTEQVRQERINRDKKKYHSSEQVRQERINKAKKKYHSYDQVKKSTKERAKKDKTRKKMTLSKIDAMIEEFHKACKASPDYVCCCCYRMMFRKQVKLCHPLTYEHKEIANIVISRKYLHICEDTCRENCVTGRGPRASLYICFTCDRHLKNGRIPPESHANGLELLDVPPELRNLNSLERQLISPRIPFMKIVRLPRGNERGVIGSCICVPADMEKTKNTLPRALHDAHIVPVKLKRKLKYKGHVNYQLVDVTKCERALEILKGTSPRCFNTNVVQTNKIQSADANLQCLLTNDSENLPHCYSTSTDEYEHNGNSLNSPICQSYHLSSSTDEYEYDSKSFDRPVDWKEEEVDLEQRLSKPAKNHNIPLKKMDACDFVQMKPIVDISDEDSHDGVPNHNKPGPSTSHEGEMSDVYDEEFSSDEDETPLRGLQMDTCMQPVDLASEVLARHDDIIYNVAPSEDQKPVSIFEEKNLEALSFPVQFPTGECTFDADRSSKLSRSKYFDSRLRHVDGRFASDPQYIFFAQYTTELSQMSSSISISMRQGSAKGRDGTRITASMLSDASQLRKLIQTNHGFRFMQPIRGSPQYWDKTMNELFAIMRQKGTPTWFCSFSCAELSRWPEVVESIMRHQGKEVTFENMTYQERCNAVSQNPVIAVTMFCNRVKEFIRTCIYGAANPIGEVVHHFYRLEFQQRGSPHIHCLFWVRNAPQLDKDADKDVLDFVSKYVWCHIPEEESLKEKVLAVQMHNPKHSKSCKKGKKKCRFLFPKQPADEPFIVRPCDSESDDSASNMSVQQAKESLQKLTEYLETGDFHEDDDYLSIAGFRDVCEYKKALSLITQKTMLVLKRGATDVWVNNYNPHLLQAWNANLDIQPIENAYSCIKYMTSYVCKSEHELGELMKSAREEMSCGNDDLRTQMKKIGSVYFKNREMCVQEAVVRVCGLHLKDCSCDVVFLPTDENAMRMSLPLSQIERLASNDKSSEQIWMPSLYDKYTSRPGGNEFETMCYAQYVSEFRFIGNQKTSDKNPNVFSLPKNLGKIQRRTPGKEAVIRFMKCSPTKEPERYFMTKLKLYLPHRNKVHLKPPTHETYEGFHNTGAVKLLNTDEVKYVKDIVDINKAKFEAIGEELDNAIDEFRENGNIEDAWALVSPHTEQQRIECTEELVAERFLDEEDDIPELDTKTRNTKSSPSSFLPQIQYNAENMKVEMERMNTRQAEVFYSVRRWCIEKACGENPDPFFLLLTGGAGVGKSHVVRCISYEASRILRNPEHPGALKVLLAAPTGTAAFNINGSTLHHALSLPLWLPEPYQAISDNVLQDLRSNIEHIDILIIDEISMVHGKTLMYIHNRLQQLKNKRGLSDAFGGVSILAVGDFYQLPPVDGQSLITPGNLYAQMYWLPYFKIAELTEVMRQKDDAAFAHMLNRIRVRKINDPILEEDLCMLVERNDRQDVPKDALHTFALGKPADDYNNLMLMELIAESGQQLHENMAVDYRKTTSGNHKKLDQPVSTDRNALPQMLRLCVGAPVMLMRNTDVNDGLVNGAVGKVHALKFDNSAESGKLVSILVKFDSELVGRRQVIRDGADRGCIDIGIYEEQLRGKSIVRRQFPLRLSWGITIHKTQGMTLKRIVVSCKSIRNSGQAYVGFSRASTLEGLYISDFNPKFIHCDENVESSLMLLPPLENTEKYLPCNQCLLSLMHHNVEGLLNNFGGVQKLVTAKGYDIVMLTETWLESNISSDAIAIDGYSVYRRDIDHDSAEHNRGGVCIFVKCELQTSRIDLGSSQIQYTAVLVRKKEDAFVCIAVYRAPNFNTKKFCSRLQSLIQKALLCLETSAVLCSGDFNEDLQRPGAHPIRDTFTKYGFTQHIAKPTTLKNTLIDHVYIRPHKSLQVTSGVIQTYYSYHDVTCALIKSAD